MKKLTCTLLCAIMVLTMLFTCSCGGDGKSKTDAKVTLLDMTAEEAQKEVESAGGKAILTTVYSEDYDDGAVLSLGSLTDGDYVTVMVNDLSIKDSIEQQFLAPVVIEKSRYEEQIYNKTDSATQKKLDAFYTLIEKGETDESKTDSYPMTSDELSVYVLDTKTSDKEFAQLQGYITEQTDYSYDDLLKDYIQCGVVPTPNSDMAPAVLSGDDVEYEENDGELTLTGYASSSQVVVIPSEIDGKPVTVVAKGAVPQSTLHAVYIEDGVRTLASEAFSHAYGLLNIYTPSTLWSVGENAFNVPLFTVTDNDGYETLDSSILVSYTGDDATAAIPDSIVHIAGGAFAKNSTLTEVVIPDTVLSIGDMAFTQCENMTKMNIPSSCLRVGDSAFYQVRHITEINIPDATLEIGNSAFFECNDVCAVVIGKNVKKIGDFAFDYCLGNEKAGTTFNAVTIPDSVEYIGDGAFYKCKNLATVVGGTNISFLGGAAFEEDIWYSLLEDDFNMLGTNLVRYRGTAKEIVIPDGVLCISGAFKNMSAITSVKINDGCKSISNESFASCSKLTSVEIPDSVTFIAEKAFSGANTVVIKCSSGSYAEQFAKDNHIKCEAK